MARGGYRTACRMHCIGIRNVEGDEKTGIVKPNSLPLPSGQRRISASDLNSDQRLVIVETSSE